MKYLKLLVVTTFIFGILSPSLAVQVKTKSGNLKFLKDVKKFNVVFDWSEVEIGRRNLSEEEFLEKEAQERNKDEPGKGDKYIANWHNDKTEFYHPHFVELLNKYIDNVNLKAEENIDAKYTLTVKVIHFEKGYNVGVMRKSSEVTFDFIWTETATGKEVCKQSIKNAKGAGAAGYDFDVVARVKESFALAGKRLAKAIRKTF